MRLYRLDRVQRLPVSLDEAWQYFSNPLNLGEITPPSLGLRVVEGGDEPMHPGMLISYRVHPILKLRLSWVTEITHVREPFYFVDEQRFGPYRFWHHQHRFSEVSGGVEVSDIVHYALPFGPIGRIAHHAVVARNLGRIFDYRRKVLEDRFGPPSTHTESQAYDAAFTR